MQLRRIHFTWIIGITTAHPFLCPSATVKSYFLSPQNTHQSQRGAPTCIKSPSQTRIRAEVLFLRVRSRPVKHAQQPKRCSCVSEVTQPNTHQSQRGTPACLKSPSQARTAAKEVFLRVRSHPVKHAQQPKRCSYVSEVT